MSDSVALKMGWFDLLVLKVSGFRTEELPSGPLRCLNPKARSLNPTWRFLGSCKWGTSNPTYSCP